MVYFVHNDIGISYLDNKYDVTLFNWCSVDVVVTHQGYIALIIITTNKHVTVRVLSRLVMLLTHVVI